MKQLSLLLMVVITACGGGKKNNDNSDLLGPLDASEGPDGPVTLACDPLAQTGCNAGEKCAWVVLQEMPSVGAIQCVTDGVIAVGAACTYGAAGAQGFSNCVKGSECVGGVCKSICDLSNGNPMCDAQHACSRYSDFLENADVTVAGVCDVRCDPKTQDAVVPTPVTAACGSQPTMTMPNGGADMPTVGCYGDMVDFTCARIPAAAKGKTDLMQAYGPSATQAFINGCEAGYLPFVRPMSGSMQVACAGICDPAPADSATLGNSTGGAAPTKLPADATAVANHGKCIPGAKGSLANNNNNPNNGQNCLYGWFFNVDMGAILESDFNDNTGICWAATERYTFDDDNNPQTPAVPWPNCKSLPGGSYAAPPANCTCTAADGCSGTGCPLGIAVDWGCHPTTDLAQAFGKRVVPASVRNHFEQMPRLFRTGEVTRHTLN